MNIPTDRSRRRALARMIVASLSASGVSCGTIIHPDRIGRPHRGRLDTSIVLLDALGLLLFFVPGVIAFVVDFATGAIYLPAHECAESEREDREGDYVVARVDPGLLTRRRIEEIVTRKTGRTLRLEAGAYSARKLERLHDFRTEKEVLARASVRPPSEVIFRAQQ